MNAAPAPLSGVWSMLGVTHLAGTTPALPEGPCSEFRALLEHVPHVVLADTTGPIAPIYSDIYRNGWRMIPEILADGPGSGVYGIQRNGVRCVVSWEQPAYIDDDGTFVQSDTFTMAIQCRSAGPA